MRLSTVILKPTHALPEGHMARTLIVVAAVVIAAHGLIHDAVILAAVFVFSRTVGALS